MTEPVNFYAAAWQNLKRRRVQSLGAHWHKKFGDEQISEHSLGKYGAVVGNLLGKLPKSSSDRRVNSSQMSFKQDHA